MKISFSSFGQYPIASVELPETEIRGDGGHVAPILRVPLRLNVWHGHMQPRQGIGIDSLHGRLAFNDHKRLGHAQSVVINHRLHPEYCRVDDHHLGLEFELDPVKLARLELVRGGGDLRLHLDLELYADSLVALNQPASPDETVWGISQRWRMTGHAEFVVPRDVWIANVLPNVGHGIIHVIEFPAAPVEGCAFLKDAFHALRDAQELHKQGHYDEAVGKCRIALESILERVKTIGPDGSERSIPQLPASWEKKLGTRTYEWLASMFPPLKDAANKVMHPPYTDRFDMLGSQLLLAVTTALMSYSARIAKD